MNKIKYENVYSMLLDGSRGQTTPYVELNGGEIAGDSNRIMETLGRHFGDCDGGVLGGNSALSVSAKNFLFKFKLQESIERRCRGQWLE